MGKRSRDRARTNATTTAEPTGAGDVGAVGPRQPCPCGSGKRYKNCHGREGGATHVYVRRPFEGIRAECDLIAMRELVPAATAPLGFEDGVVPDDRAVRLCSLLPAAAPALVREDGTIWL